MCTLRYDSRSMNTRKRSESVQFTLRLSRSQADRFEKIQNELNAKSKSDVFDYLVTFASASRASKADAIASQTLSGIGFTGSLR